MTPPGVFAFEKGIESIRNSRFSEAERWFSITLRQAPDDHDASERRAYVRERLGRLSASARDYRTCLSQAPRCGVCLQGAADLALKRGRPREAEALLSRAVRAEPGNPDYRLDRGWARLRLNRCRAAIRDFNRILTDRSLSMLALLSRGAARAILGDLRRALSDSHRAVLIRPDSGENYFVRGLVRFLSKDLKGAAADFERAGKRAPRGRMTPARARKLLRSAL